MCSGYIIIAFLGKSGLTKLNAQLDNIIGNLVLSEGLVQQSSMKIVATNLDIYKAISLASTSLSQFLKFMKIISCELKSH